jgi:hypothetical protein
VINKFSCQSQAYSKLSFSDKLEPVERFIDSFPLMQRQCVVRLGQKAVAKP